MKIAVLGAGGWGTALAVMWKRAGKNVRLWTPFEKERDRIVTDRENRAVLPGVEVPRDLEIVADLGLALAGAEIVFVVVPSIFVRNVALAAASVMAPSAIVVSASKGLERRGGPEPLRLSQVLAEVLPGRKIAVLSGPSHAEEVGLGLPTTIVAAGARADAIRDACSTPSFRIYTSDDLVGVELGGTLKNPIAIAAGIGAGLGAGDNALGALVTRGMVEISRLGVAAGAREKTFAGLSGIGDLVTTCASVHSRNRKVGMELAKRKPLDLILTDLGMVAEGVETAKTVERWSSAIGVETPITSAVYRVAFEGSDPELELRKMMGRELKDEF